jgi:hypothetical protein
VHGLPTIASGICRLTYFQPAVSHGRRFTASGQDLSVLWGVPTVARSAKVTGALGGTLMKGFMVRCALAACCAAASARLASGQETINSASVSGRVTDPQGKVVPGAQVKARQIETNITTTTVTDQEGRFRFPYLRIGAYELLIELEGFKPVRRSLTLTVGSAFDVPVVT